MGSSFTKLPRPVIAIVLVAILILSGCSDNAVDAVNSGIDGFALLGLVHGRTLTYLQTDTLTTFDPDYNVEVTTKELVIKLTKNGDEWIVSEGDQPRLNLRLSGENALQNGYWTDFGGTDSLFYIAEPPVLMLRPLSLGRQWEGYTPKLISGSEQLAVPFYYSNFGFYFTRTLEQTETIIVPGGTFDTYQFEVNLFATQLDSIPAATVTEYYAANVGLIKQKFVGGGLVRVLSLIDY